MLDGSKVRAAVIRMISRKGAKTQRKRSDSVALMGGAKTPAAESGAASTSTSTGLRPEYEYEGRRVESVFSLLFLLVLSAAVLVIDVSIPLLR